ncbi:P-loop containing nucleoside triphosphate hydrolase protein [Panaeolus papilionaceus]|nr:P-loop containing nucleoside triphosphate hydrolase protein [Panaeolus papilionaceus]
MHKVQIRGSGIQFLLATRLLLPSFWSLSKESEGSRTMSEIPRRHRGRVIVGFMTGRLRSVASRDLYIIPKDGSEGGLLWVEIGILFVVAIVIPLFIPRRYVPVNPEEPMEITNPEQTCSLFAFAIYSYITPVISQGARVEHLLPKDLPPLPDTDWAKNIKANGFPKLDTFSGAKGGHIFFGLLRVYKNQFIVNAFCLVGQALCNMASPIGVYRILAYLENPNTPGTIRPWFWVSWIFFGPAIDRLLLQWYSFISMRMLVRTEGLLTQLVFEHSLRARMAFDVSPTSSSTIVIDELSADGPTSAMKRSAENVEAGSSSSPSPSPDPRASTPDRKSKEEISQKAATVKETEASNLFGKINNLVTTDLANIVGGRDVLVLVVFIPAQIILCLAFLYKILGWSSFVGLGVMILLFPIPGMIVKELQQTQRQRMKATDARVQDVTEAVGIMRMIKLFGWENRIADRIQDKRDEELKHLGKLKMLQAFNDMANSLVPRLAMAATYASYTLIMKEELDASKIFSSITVFSLLGLQMHRLSFQGAAAVQAKVSLDRMNDFLHETELLDSFKTPSRSSVDVTPSNSRRSDEMIGFKDGSFSWTIDSMSRARSFKLKIPGEMLFKQDCLNVIIGPTGSGKTSLLMALLGEMHFIPTSSDSWFNLPRGRGVSYAAQESWIQNDTIRNNILFGSPYEAERYKKVIKQCALERDLELFKAGDETEVGEKGLTLSGGQKARVALARAVYSHTQIVLLDDILAALDVHTSTWVVSKCLQGDLLQGRTVILVTHNVALVAPIAQYFISLGQDGVIKYYGTDMTIAIPDFQENTITHLQEEEHPIQVPEESALEPRNQDSKVDGKLVVEEEVAKGQITRKSFGLFLSALGGKHPVAFFAAWVGGFFLEDWLLLSQRWFLGYWGTQYETHPESEVQVSLYLFAICDWHLAGFQKDPRNVIDDPLTATFGALVDVLVCMATRLILVIIFTPAFLAPALGVVLLGTYLGNVYLKAQISIKREMSNARSPVLSHFTAAIAGIVSIRAYGAQVPFKLESLKRIDHYLRIARTSYNLDRWIAVRADLTAAAFNASLAAYLVYFRSIGAANTGFLLNVSVDLCSLILWAVRLSNSMQVQSNSLERVQDYLSIEHETPATESGKPPAAWPRSGDLIAKNLTARYSKKAQTGPAVLHNISFDIKSGQRIGIVGRTGSGKSSLTLALLRCILTEGSVYYDGVRTNSINLGALRSSITIIPQAPELLSGTLRRNLDPLEEHDDVTLNNALRAAGLFSLQEGSDGERITLDSNVASGGGNFSVGQRQIISLARAIVRGSKLLILDEDYKTDNIIQNSLRNELSRDTTIITIAHRLQTIMDADKIMVLDNGRIVEFDSPETLLSLEGGTLKSFVDGSNDRDTLYSMTRGKAGVLPIEK